MKTPVFLLGSLTKKNISVFLFLFLACLAAPFALAQTMPPSLSRFRATRAGLLALFCAGGLRVRCGHVLRFFKNLSRTLSVFSSSFAGFGQKLPLSPFPVSGLPPELPLMSPFGLPSAGCPASARWHVFQFVVKSQHPKNGQMARLPNSELGRK